MRVKLPLPRTMFGRMVLILLATVLAAQALVSVVWRSQVVNRDEQTLREVSRSLALSVASTARFFNALPADYRHIVLNQLRSIGGTRFFVSINSEQLQMSALTTTPRQDLVRAEVAGTVRQQLGARHDVQVIFTTADELRILNNQTRLSDLPPTWAEYSLTLHPLDPPILVTQIQLADHQWLYLAALLPMPLLPLDDSYLNPRDLLLFSLTAVLLLAAAALLSRWVARPLKRLVRAARDLGAQREAPPIPEQGPNEVREAARALNAMQRQLDRYIQDRAQLFSSISHDLKTPITRLRLRVELLDDDEQRHNLLRNLDELELLVKGALQCVKETDIHENLEPVDIALLLQQLRSDLAEPERLTVTGGCRPLRGKPLALKRCLTNLVDNALKYGERAEITLVDQPERLFISLRDHGPGIPLHMRDRVFEPYFRLPVDHQGKPGDGLGLGIARNIIHGHGGTLTLTNHPRGGLLVKIELPHSSGM